MDDSFAIKDALTIASPFIKTVVDTFVTPKLEKFRNRLTDENNINLLPIESNFTEYFHRTYKRLMVVNTLVFNNSQRFLDDIYVPLTIECKSERRVRLKIKGFPDKLSNDYSNILITDTAGMGKSTLMKTIFIDCINRQLGIPIFIELRRLSKEKTLIDEIIEQLNSIDKNFDKELLYELLADGEFIFILDGYDEITLKDREVVTTDIQNFINKAGNNKYFITSRPEKALLSFGSFREFYIHPLIKKEAYELLRKYDKQGHISSMLIKKLEEEYLQNIEEFLVNPLLVSLLFTAFEHKQSIPFKKHLFYRQVYDANFENHDLTKGDSYIHKKYSNLEIDDFHRVLRHIGFSCLKSQKIEFTKDEILKLISESKVFCVGLEFTESNFLSDILKTVPLFSEDGNYYKWSHKSLQEYFAAQFIFLDAKKNQSKIIDLIYNHADLDKFINVLDLYYDMDYKTFRYRIEFKILEEYHHHLQNYYQNFKSDLNLQLIPLRAEMTFLNETVIFYLDEDIDEDEEAHNDNMTDMITSISEQNNLDDILVSQIRIFKLQKLNLFQYVHPKNKLFYIFENKKNPIVKKFSSEKYDFSSNFPFEFNEEVKFARIDYVYNDGVNNEKNFKEINSLISDYVDESIIINHSEAIKRFNEIKNEIDKGSDEFLLEGL
ncbi:NACHT domain-containing protein [Chryseobacterium sp. CFS15]|uniref:NACHT domain-containing protein n=1 Tax=Chryseobacterium sp. CFS15 TaxID=2986946 RepID=UPI00280810CB|nr:NACHT domain-containing protein [Chryseobacterium sp. CFS15]MDQ8140752.1 NACHT domain-containing protein [Chryseobacterium sp. CFS15]